MTDRTWRRWLPAGARAYFERGPLVALALGVSSGFPAALIGATLTTRLAQDGIDKKAVTAFSIAFLTYNLKVLWAWIIDTKRLPLIGHWGQRMSWMLFIGVCVILAVINLAFVDPRASLLETAIAAILLGLAGASFDIIIDAYRIESLTPAQLGAGAGMSQYGWRIGAAGAAALALLVAARYGWTAAYLICALLALPAMLVALILGEPPRHRPPQHTPGLSQFRKSLEPVAEFFRRRGAMLVFLFILLHKLGDTLANLTLRLLFQDIGFTNDAIAIWDVGLGFWAYLIGIFLGGYIYGKWGVKRSVMLSLILMGVSNLSFALLAMVGDSNIGLGAAIGFENMASGIGGVTVVAYFSALCDLRYTAAQYALISAGASVLGRLLSGTTAGALIESWGYVDYYVMTTVMALPGIILFALMIKRGLVEEPAKDQDALSDRPPVS